MVVVVVVLVVVVVVVEEEEEEEEERGKKVKGRRTQSIGRKTGTPKNGFLGQPSHYIGPHSTVPCD